jgi:hypothetical protein
MIEPGASMRRAALLVHAMDASDRAWVLTQLAPEERDPLAAMLAELRALGIPAERELLKQAAAEMPRESDAVRDSESAPRDMPAPDMSSPAALLRRADPALVARVLRAEPSALVAAVLALDAWPWHETVLIQLGTVKRSEVRELLARDARPAARLREHALPAVAGRVEELALAIAARTNDAGRDFIDRNPPRRERHLRGWRHLLARARPGPGGT